MIKPFAAKPVWPVTLGAFALLAGCGSPASVAPTSAVASAQAERAGEAGRLEFLTSAKVASRLAEWRPVRKSWMAARVKGPLLYVSDAAVGVVLAYSWPQLRLVGNLSGFDVPQGECVDGAGDIWIANTKQSQMRKYAPGSTQLLKTLPDRGQYPVGCAVSPDGDLAVTNIISRKSTPGSLSIYPGASGHPTIYSDPALSKVYFDGYSSNGTLFLDGEDSGGAFAMAEFDGKSFTPLSVSGATINSPGAVQVVGSYVNVEDQLGSSGNSIMYRTTLSGTTLTVDATAQLGNSMDCVGSYISGKGSRQKVICPDAVTPSIYVYAYPAGGDPVDALYQNVVEPNSAVITRN
jgi:hypothetical protein